MIDIPKLKSRAFSLLLLLSLTASAAAELPAESKSEQTPDVLSSELSSEEKLWLLNHKVIGLETENAETPNPSVSLPLPINLSAREKSWLAKHKSIKIAFDGSMPPYSFINKSNEYEGIAIDIFDILSQRLGVHFQTTKETNWKKLYKKAARRKIDVVATMVNRPERQFWFNFTQPYIKKSLVILTRKNDSSIAKRSDLAGKKVALLKDYQYSHEAIKEFPSIKPFYVNSMQDGLNLVSQEKTDAAIIFSASAHYLQNKYQLDELEFVDFYDRNSTDESIAVRKDWPMLASILQKGLDSISEKEISSIYTQWVAPPAPNSTAALVTTPKEPPPGQPIANTHTLPKPTMPVVKVDTAGLKPDLSLEVLASFLGLLLLIYNQNKKIKLANVNAENANRIVQQLQCDIDNLLTNRRAELSYHEHTFRSLIENQNTEYFFYQYDCDGQFTYISPSIALILGYTPDDFKQHYRKYLTDNPVNLKVPSFIQDCTQGIPNPPYQIEIYDSKGLVHWLEVSDSPVYDDYGICTGVDGVMHEITARKEAADHLVWLSYYDELTGLANRRLFMDRLQQSINLTLRKNLSFSLLFLDLDQFKTVNDTMGHSTGDEVLKEAANRLLSALRDSDVAARFGGDEFALLLPETSREASVLVAEKIIKSLKNAYVFGEQLINLGVSIGIAVYPEDGNNCEALIKQADSAMYYAKKQSLGFAFVPGNC